MNNFFDDQIGDSQAAADTANERAETEEIVSQTADALYIPKNIKSATQELMKYGLLEMERKPKLYQTALTQQQHINNILAPLDLRLQIDDVRGLAFLVVNEETFSENEDDEWSHPLIRRQRLTLEQTLLIAILRQYYIAHEQDAGIGAGRAMIDIDELKPQLFTYLGESGSDARDRARLVKLLEQLYAHGIVSEIDDKAQVIIRPIITHVANPETLQLLLQHFRKMSTTKPAEHEQ